MSEGPTEEQSGMETFSVNRLKSRSKGLAVKFRSTSFSLETAKALSPVSAHCRLARERLHRQHDVLLFMRSQFCMPTKTSIMAGRPLARMYSSGQMSYRSCRCPSLICTPHIALWGDASLALIYMCSRLSLDMPATTGVCPSSPSTIDYQALLH